MGIADRDYSRRKPPTPGSYGSVGVRSLRMWSMNTWIIVICVAVFVIDVFTPSLRINMGTSFRSDLPASIDLKSVVAGELRDVNGSSEEPLYVSTSQGMVQVGVRHYTNMQLLEGILHFSTAKGFLQFEFWRLIGFQFLHANLTHLLFNMLGLYFFGPMVEHSLGSKRYLAFYLLCGIFGALMYVLLNLGGMVASSVLGLQVAIPGLLFHDPYMPLIGASAGVYGVIMAGAFLAPHTTVLLFFIIPMRLATLAYGLVIVAFVSILMGSHNAGGEAGHLGGAIAGFYFIRHSHHLHGFFDFLGRIDPTSHHYRGKTAGARAVGKMRGRASGGASGGGGLDRVEIDRILDKVQAEGLASLTASERRILREASDRYG